jgi:hypothetical protein
MGADGGNPGTIGLGRYDKRQNEWWCCGNGAKRQLRMTLLVARFMEAVSLASNSVRDSDMVYRGCHSVPRAYCIVELCPIRFCCG